MSIKQIINNSNDTKNKITNGKIIFDEQSLQLFAAGKIVEFNFVNLVKLFAADEADEACTRLVEPILFIGNETDDAAFNKIKIVVVVIVERTNTTGRQATAAVQLYIIIIILKSTCLLAFKRVTKFNFR